MSLMSAEPVADSLILSPLPRQRDAPGFEIERRLKKAGRHYVAGVDEAGRGPIAGPVVAAAVVLDARRIPNGLNDSKKLDAQTRENLFEELAATATIAWCGIRAPEIDRVNIRRATLEAMRSAIFRLPMEPDAILIDGRDIPPSCGGKAHAIVGGDAICQSIAAASIVAKVVRDRMMRRAGETYPEYGFCQHVGYCTPFHLRQLNRLGPCELHRKSFAPVAALLEQLPADRARRSIAIEATIR
jgi:ribonuclease HII